MFPRQKAYSLSPLNLRFVNLIALVVFLICGVIFVARLELLLLLLSTTLAFVNFRWRLKLVGRTKLTTHSQQEFECLWLVINASTVELTVRYR